MARRSSGGPPRRLARRAYARVVVHLRWLVLAGWVVAAGAAYLHLPALTPTAGGGGLEAFLPDHSAALRTERQMAGEFGAPLLFETMVVQRDPHGLDPRTQLRVVSSAVRVDRDHPSDLTGITAAVPLVNTAGVLPFSRERSTTAVTYLAFPPDTSLQGRVDLAHRYAADSFADLPDHGSVVGVTGPTPGRLAQAELIDGHLQWVELAGILVVALIVGWEFRSVIAPLVTLLAAALGYVVTTRVAAWAGQRYGVVVPSELEPLVVVLLLGVVTDYSVFFLSGVRDRLRAGEDRRVAVRHAVVANVVWVMGAGIAVAAGTAVLLVSRLDIFHALGPGMGVTVLIGLVVCLTFVPALLAFLGRAAFWPRGLPRRDAEDRADAPDPSGDALPSGIRARVIRVVAVRPVAALVVLLLGAGLVVAAWQIREARVGVSILAGLPDGSEASRAEAAAAEGFAPGVLAPTAVVVSADGITKDRSALARLQELLGAEPGVAGVLGPGSLPLPDRYGAFLAPDGDAARYAVVLDSPPLTAPAIAELARLKDRLPSLADRAGLGSATTTVGGDTALSAEIVDTTLRDMLRVAGLALLVDLVVVLLFLRSLVAALYLLVADALSLGATLGITTLLSDRVLGYVQYDFYVPFAVIVLLIAFGSDYEIFLVGRIWDEARVRPLRDALVRSGPRAARAITIAGLALAASFATLAIVPLQPFRQFALAMVVGVLLEVLVVRPLLVPALISLFGRAGAWPRRPARPVAEPVPG